MKFKAGQSGNPGGRPKGCSGRMQALAILDVMMVHAKNRRALKAAMQKAFDANPMQFFRTVIMPLLPKESKVALDHDVVVQWKSLLERGAGEG